jgi:hypothetical protein
MLSLKVEAVTSSETSVKSYETTWYHIPEVTTVRVKNFTKLTVFVIFRAV